MAIVAVVALLAIFGVILTIGAMANPPRNTLAVALLVVSLAVLLLALTPLVRVYVGG
jgi:hypothetical protein